MYICIHIYNYVDIKEYKCILSVKMRVGLRRGFYTKNMQIIIKLMFAAWCILLSLLLSGCLFIVAVLAVLCCCTLWLLLICTKWCLCMQCMHAGIACIHICVHADISCMHARIACMQACTEVYEHSVQALSRADGGSQEAHRHPAG